MEATLHQKKVIDSIGRYVKVNNLRVGDKLPPIRSIAEEFGFAQVTVAQAIKSLARNGFVESKTKVGTTIRKDIEFQPRKHTCRVLLISDVDYNGSFHPLTQIITGIKSAVASAEIVQLWLSFESGEEVLKNVLCYHYSMRKDQEKIVFLLAHCPMWAKAFFQRNDVPAVVVGGVEEGINLPHVTISPSAVLSRIKDALDKNDGYPATLLMCSEEPLGAHRYYYDHFKGIHHDTSIVRLHSAAEVARTQLLELLTGPCRPKTIIIQGDDAACPIIKLCWQNGVKIPEDIGIISLETFPLAEQLSPTITGIYHGYTSIGEKLGRLVDKITKGEDASLCDSDLAPILVYRESFKTPL